jgi:hypothetical protein
MRSIITLYETGEVMGNTSLMNKRKPYINIDCELSDIYSSVELLNNVKIAFYILGAIKTSKRMQL